MKFLRRLKFIVAKFNEAKYQPIIVEKFISKHISYKEATQSQTAARKGINNTPDTKQLIAMKNVAERCFEPVREWYGKPINISSFLRVNELNLAVGGSSTSEHPKGYCIDMDTDKDNRAIFEWCIDNLKFDQLIWEFGGKWVHISYRIDESKNRNMILDARVINGITKYIDITDK